MTPTSTIHANGGLTKRFLWTNPTRFQRFGRFCVVGAIVRYCKLPWAYTTGVTQEGPFPETVAFFRRPLTPSILCQGVSRALASSNSSKSAVPNQRLGIFGHNRKQIIPSLRLDQFMVRCTCCPQLASYKHTKSSPAGKFSPCLFCLVEPFPYLALVSGLLKRDKQCRGVETPGAQRPAGMNLEPQTRLV